MTGVCGLPRLTISQPRLCDVTQPLPPARARRTQAPCLSCGGFPGRRVHATAAAAYHSAIVRTSKGTAAVTCSLVRTSGITWPQLPCTSVACGKAGPGHCRRRHGPASAHLQQRLPQRRQPPLKELAFPLYQPPWRGRQRTPFLALARRHRHRHQHRRHHRARRLAAGDADSTLPRSAAPWPQPRLVHHGTARLGTRPCTAWSHRAARRRRPRPRAQRPQPGRQPMPAWPRHARARTRVGSPPPDGGTGSGSGASR